MVSLPRSVRLAAWATSWITGHGTVEDVVQRVRGADEPHTVDGMSPFESLAEALEAWRAAGARSVAVALPRPGDPVGLGGPPELNAAAIEAGEAAVAVGAAYALVPRVTPFGPPGDQGHFVAWTWHDADPPSPGPDVQEADRALNDALLEAGSALSALDVARWRPEVAQLLEDVRSGRKSAPLPNSFPPEAQALAARAARLRTIAEFALADDGAAVTAAEAAARQEALRPLERAARHGLVAACNAVPG